MTVVQYNATIMFNFTLTQIFLFAASWIRRVSLWCWGQWLRVVPPSPVRWGEEPLDQCHWTSQGLFLSTPLFHWAGHWFLLSLCSRQSLGTAVRTASGGRALCCPSPQPPASPPPPPRPSRSVSFKVLSSFPCFKYNFCGLFGAARPRLEGEACWNGDFPRHFVSPSWITTKLFWCMCISSGPPDHSWLWVPVSSSQWSDSRPFFYRHWSDLEIPSTLICFHLISSSHVSLYSYFQSMGWLLWTTCSLFRLRLNAVIHSVACELWNIIHSSISDHVYTNSSGLRTLWIRMPECDSIYCQLSYELIPALQNVAGNNSRAMVSQHWAFHHCMP